MDGIESNGSVDGSSRDFVRDSADDDLTYFDLLEGQSLADLVDVWQAERLAKCPRKYTFLAGLHVPADTAAVLWEALWPILSHPDFIWTGDDCVESVVPVSTLRAGMVIAYLSDSLYHTGIVKEVRDAGRKLVRLWHNHPDNLTGSAGDTIEDLSQCSIYEVVLKPGAIVGGYEDRRKPSRFLQQFGDYHAITNNCEHFVTYALFGQRRSFVADLLRLVGWDLFGARACWNCGRGFSCLGLDCEAGGAPKWT